jgi:hypothetical protein
MLNASVTSTVTNVNGRPKDSPVWDYYKYSIDLDTTTCCVQIQVAGGTGSTKACGRVLKGKNPTNMKVHLSAVHKPEYAEFVVKHRKLLESKSKPSQLNLKSRNKSDGGNEMTKTQNMQTKISWYTKQGALYPASSNKYCEKMWSARFRHVVG